MVTKTITIMNDAYKLLARFKSKGESFSDVIRKIAKREGNILECAGLWSDIRDKDAMEMEEAIMRLRKSTTKSLKKKLNLK